jgi:hypothetical protein
MTINQFVKKDIHDNLSVDGSADDNSSFGKREAIGTVINVFIETI